MSLYTIRNEQNHLAVAKWDGTAMAYIVTQIYLIVCGMCIYTYSIYAKYECDAQHSYGKLCSDYDKAGYLYT